MPDTDMITVRRDDAEALLREVEGWIGGKDNGAFARLAAAAGVQ